MRLQHRDKIHEPYQAVVIGVSAGGMEALSDLLPPLPDEFSWPIIIVQHMHPTQGDYLAELLCRRCAVKAKEADDKEKIQPGWIYLAPPNYHLLIERDQTFSLSVDEKVNFARPSIDVLFESAVDAYGSGLIGIILTGANHDGAYGLHLIKQCGGLTIVQDPAHAAHPVMPRSALDMTKVDHVLPIPGITRLLIELETATRYGNRAGLKTTLS
ncbi:MAG: chemotaxis protein CheB [Deltaproteobacteria bacterium]|nr:chemotaxis protein CheB [Deltaproteobacteria bacterium]